MKLTSITCAAGIVMLISQPLVARPIVYAHSLTVMAEFSEDSMQEFQAFYAPRFNWSFGAGHLQLEGHGANSKHEDTYARVNFLAKRWNMEAAQANVFVWGGAGQARSVEWVPEVTPPPGEHDHGGDPATVPGYERRLWANSWNAGAQIDYETRRIYTMLKSDWHDSAIFSHRIDTVQLGFAPYKHDIDTVATWLVLSGTRHSGDGHNADELALLLRFFKSRFWIEAGATTDGKLRAHMRLSL